ncbi:hypothetical protein [Trinickia acidisoli]|uniref:hypothetical protein n=1 Tax=Trinickia acidisoli TaxID=2767482 RepID=UPI001A8C1381|nr:hypothetical protein [Trinickia acidisoli]
MKSPALPPDTPSANRADGPPGLRGMARGERICDEAVAALDTLGTAWRIEMSAPVQILLARLVCPRSHSGHEAFLAWLEQVCTESTFAALLAEARRLALARLGLIRARQRASFDIVQEVAQPLWPDVLAAWAGLGDQQRRRLHHLACVLGALAEPDQLCPRRLAGLTVALDELRRMFVQAYRYPRYTRCVPNLFAALETAWRPRLGPIQDEATAAATQLLLTGSRAASELTGPAIEMLLARPALLARLRATPCAAASFVDDLQTTLAQRRARLHRPPTFDAAAFALMSRPLARMLAQAVVEALVASHERVGRDRRSHGTPLRRDATAPLDHLALRVGL